nr:Cwp1p [Saccharomyces cerevisiae]
MKFSTALSVALFALAKMVLPIPKNSAW